MLKPGSNSVHLEYKVWGVLIVRQRYPEICSNLSFLSHWQQEVQAGSFHLGQLCVNIFDKLLFLSAENFYADTKYNVVKIAPEISFEIVENRTLIAGIPSTLSLCVHLGTYSLNEVSHSSSEV